MFFPLAFDCGHPHQDSIEYLAIIVMYPVGPQKFSCAVLALTAALGFAPLVPGTLVSISLR